MLDAQLDRLKRTRLERLRRLLKLDTEPASRAALLRRRRECLLLAVAAHSHLDGLAATARDDINELCACRHRFAVDSQDDVARLQAGLLGAIAGNHAHDFGIRFRLHADVADFVPALGDRPHVHREVLTVSQDGHAHVTVWPTQADRQLEVLPRRDLIT